MISEATKWHVERRKAILAAHPEIKSLPKHDRWALWTVFGTFAIQTTVAIACKDFSILVIFLLAWSIGGLCVAYMNNNLHELFHRLMTPNSEGWKQEWLMRIGCLPSYTLLNYALYRFGHMTHHARLGAQTVTDAKAYLTEKHADNELLLQRLYYTVLHDENEVPRRMFGRWLFGSPFMKFCYLLLIPIVTFGMGILMNFMVLVAFFKCLILRDSGYYRPKVYALTFQIFCMAVMTAGIYTFGGFGGLIYLAFCELFLRGFLLYPTAIFFMTNHRTFGTAEAYQPTTSVMGRAAHLFFMGANHHIEHHDFPDIPRRFLPMVRKLAPEFYEPLTTYSGFWAAIRDFLRDNDWAYAGTFKGVSKDLQGEEYVAGSFESFDFSEQKST